MKIAVIGAGPAGLSAALHLVKSSPHFHVDLYEAAPEVGGLSRSFYLFDHIVDLGPHRFFTQDKKIMDFWLDLAKNKYHVVDRQTSILYNKHHLSYPLTAADLLKSLPFLTKIKILFSFFKRKKHKLSDGQNFATTMRYRFGDVLYELFFKEYTEKLWGISDTKLSASVAYQRIGGFGLWPAIAHALKAYFISVVGTFMYPQTGCGQIWEEAGLQFQQQGGHLYLSTPVKAIEKHREGYALQTDQGIQYYDFVLSSMPLTQFIRIYKNSSQAAKDNIQKLQFRSTVLVYVEVEGECRFDDQWIYINSKDVRSGRITNFSNWGIPHNSRQGTHVLCLEYWCHAGDETWKQHDNIWKDVANSDLVNIGYGSKQLRRSYVHRLANTYPVVTNEAEVFMQDFAKELESHKQLLTIGRGGAFKYNNQDHCIDVGLCAAKIVLGEMSNIWAVNSAKSYHESHLVKNSVPPG